MANRALLDIVKIDKWLVMELIHDNGLSIAKLGEDPRVNRCEKTIRRWLNRWEMPKSLLLSIAQVLGISYSVLAIPTSDSVEYEKNFNSKENKSCSIAHEVAQLLNKRGMCVKLDYEVFSNMLVLYIQEEN